LVVVVVVVVVVGGGGEFFVVGWGWVGLWFGLGGHFDG
jgi:hypothetical protein